MTVLSRGARGEAVRDLQRMLNQSGVTPPLVEDGDFGGKTESAVKQFQQGRDLPITGIADEPTCAALLGKPEGDDVPFYIGAAKRLSDADFKALAAKHGIEEAKIRAVNEVEAAGEGFYSSGALKCLYEPHIAWKYTNGAVREALAREGLAYQRWKPGAYPKSSFLRIDRCAEIAGDEVSCLATSWGLPQMMGFNHKACGFDTALSMVRNFAESEANQLDGMIRFIKSNSLMLSALMRGDWASFASRYNGPGYKANKYDTKLAAAYARHKK